MTIHQCENKTHTQKQEKSKGSYRNSHTQRTHTLGKIKTKQIWAKIGVAFWAYRRNPEKKNTEVKAEKTLIKVIIYKKEEAEENNGES